ARVARDAGGRDVQDGLGRPAVARAAAGGRGECDQGDGNATHELSPVRTDSTARGDTTRRETPCGRFGFKRLCGRLLHRPSFSRFLPPRRSPARPRDDAERHGDLILDLDQSAGGRGRLDSVIRLLEGKLAVRGERIALHLDLERNADWFDQPMQSELSLALTLTTRC